MTDDQPRPESDDRGGVLDRRRVGAALAVGGAAVVLFELAALVLAAVRGPGGMDRGAVWTILLMILVTFGTLGGIGWGLYRLVREIDPPSDTS